MLFEIHKRILKFKIMKSIQIVALTMAMFFSFQSYSQSTKPACRSKKEIVKNTNEIKPMTRNAKNRRSNVELSQQVHQIDRKSIKSNH